MRKYKGIIFDFNGTLILDDELHFSAWKRHARELGFDISEELYFNRMHGSTNELIYELFYGKPIPDELVGVFGNQKEIYYREMFKKSPPPMAKGAKEFIDFLNDNNIPHAIATSSEISNVTFFKEIYNLEKLFGDNITYNDGTLRGKPYPDIYLRAADKLGIGADDLITVEDSASGAKACKASGSPLVIGICPRGKEKFVGAENTDMVITDFTELDYKNLLAY